MEYEQLFDDETRAFIDREAMHFGGDRGRAVASIVKAALAREQSPNRWAELEARVRGRPTSWPAPAAPVDPATQEWMNERRRQLRPEA